MRYIVEVNAKYLVSIEADTPLEAEHKLLDYNGIWGALAFDRQAMKTDTFAGAVQGCDMISIEELEELVNESMDAKKEAVEAELRMKEAEKEIERLTAKLEEAQRAYSEAVRTYREARNQHQKTVTKLGERAA